MKKNRGIRWTAAAVAVAAALAFSATAEARPYGPPPGPPPEDAFCLGAFLGVALVVGVIDAIASAAEPRPVVVEQPVVYQPVVVPGTPVVVEEGVPCGGRHGHYGHW
ncbi:MAG: hypothetical protein IK066_07085 [Kiritimatiellae bacterium]|nr:hypothetical protein [Kiritimatiellia bacterium]